MSRSQRAWTCPTSGVPGAIVRHRGPLLHVLRADGWSVALEDPHAVWLTVELSDRHRARGRVAGRRVDHVGQVGAAHISPAGHPLEIAVEGTYRAIQLRVPVALLAAAAEEDHGLDPARLEFAPLVGVADRPLARAVLRAACGPADDDAEALLREVAGRLVGHRAVPGTGTQRRRGGLAPTALARVRELVEVSLGDLTVERMAREAGLSPFHFSREFRRTTGEAPWAYVTERRLVRALRLLGEPGLPLGEVARRAGFADAAHLGHRMRERMGCSPGEARRQLIL